jgi:hypothetical protein
MLTFEEYLYVKQTRTATIEEIRLIEKFSRGNINDILEFIHEVLKSVISTDSQYNINLNFDYTRIYGKISFLKEIENFSFQDIDCCYATKFKNALHGRDPDFKISLNFKHTVFDSYIKFDSLHCEKLNFENTVFNKGARLRFINVKAIIYEPKHLGGDVTFANKYFDNEENQILDLNTKIGTFKYRHQITGTGFTFFVGIDFEKIAYFTNSILDRVHFANMNLSKCLFISSKIDKTRFYNCDFPQQENLPIMISKDTPNIFLWFLGLFFILFIMIFSIGYTNDIPFFYIFGIFIYGNLIFMPLAFLLQKIISSKISVNKHFCVYDEIMQKQDADFEQKINFNHSLREIYRQLKINFQTNEDYQTAGDFYYSQRYIEIIPLETKDGKILQWFLLNTHHWVNGFGERWLRPLFWIAITILIFMGINTPNRDYVSTPSTPVFLLEAFNQTTEKLDFNESNISHFLNIANTTYLNESDSNTSKPKEKIVFAYNNIYDYHYTKQMIPTVQNDLTTRLLYSASHFALPFMSDQKKWFQTTNSKSLYLSTIETILLWFFFGAFVLAIKNRIKR